MIGWLRRFLERRSSLANPERWLIRMLRGDETRGGIEVDYDSALSATAVFDGVRMISQDVARVPLNIYTKLDRGRQVASDHALQDVLHSEPNPEQTALEMREMVTAFAVLCGTGFAHIVADRGGRVRELWPLPPWRVTPKRTESGKRFWEVRFPEVETPQPVPASEMFVLRGFGTDGVLGADVVDKMRESIGLTLATEAFGGAFFGNGSHPSGVLEVPQLMSDKAYARLKTDWDEKHKGLKNAHKVAVLEEGAKWVSIGVPPEAAQFLETRKFQVTECARILNIPPHKLKDLERATFSNIEHQAIDYVTGSLGPWYNRWEQACDKWLLTPSERKTLYVEHVIEGLLRGDIKTRYEAYSVGRQNGWLSVNDVRERENMNPVEGGDDLHVQSNLVRLQDLEQITKAKALKPSPMPARDPSEDDDTERQRRAWAHVFLATAQRAVTREVGGVRTALRKGAGGRDQIAFRRELEEFYERHRGWLAEAFTPVHRACAEAVGEAEPEAAAAAAVIRVGDFAAGECVRALEVLRALLSDDPEQAIDRQLLAWETGKPAELAERATTQAMTTFAPRRAA